MAGVAGDPACLLEGLWLKIAKKGSGIETVTYAEALEVAPCSGRIDGQKAIIAIEASEPVPYVASQPYPSTYLIELRDVEATGFADRFKPDPRLPVRAVTRDGKVINGPAISDLTPRPLPTRA